MYPDSCPPGTFSYVIQSGDNFYHLAMKFKTTISALVSANPNVDPRLLQIGQSLCIPNQQAFPPCPQSKQYTIKSGDTLYNISRMNQVLLTDLVNANPGINPYLLQMGQIICIPTTSPSIKCSTHATTYVIKSGDTFYKLAVRHNITVSELLKANPSLRPEALMVGQTICIPKPEKALPPTKDIPVIVEGETEYHRARLNKSPQGYYIYVLNNYTFTPEEPGKDVVFSTVDDRFFVRIEKLPVDANINDLRENALTELRLIGTPHEMQGTEIFDPFFRTAQFFYQASDESISKNILVMEIKGSNYRFNMHLPNVEAAEGIIPGFYAMLKTIGNL